MDKKQLEHNLRSLSVLGDATTTSFLWSLVGSHPDATLLHTAVALLSPVVNNRGLRGQLEELIRVAWVKR